MPAFRGGPAFLETAAIALSKLPLAKEYVWIDGVAEFTVVSRQIAIATEKGLSFPHRVVQERCRSVFSSTVFTILNAAVTALIPSASVPAAASATPASAATRATRSALTERFGIAGG